jgi:hypothetical protein
MDENIECMRCHEMTARVKWWPSKRGGVWETTCPCGYSRHDAVMPPGYQSVRPAPDHKEEDRQHDLE